MELGVSRRTATVLLVLLVLIYVVKLTSREAIAERTKALLTPTAAETASLGKASFGQIKDKVAVISDTQYSSRLIPLILHFHSVLGPDWPVIFYTTQQTRDERLANSSAIWKRAVDEGRIQVRTIPAEFDLTQRHGVNLYLSRPWFWEQLAPAKHVLIFQTDAMICGNSHRTVEDFFEWDFIGAPLHGSEKYLNGGLSLRNRDMILDILREGANWEEETKSGAWTMGGEDVWFSRKMTNRGGRLPEWPTAVKFSCEHQWHVDRQKEPLGYHKVHKYAASSIKAISEWCPEIALAAPGTLKDGGE